MGTTVDDWLVSEYFVVDTPARKHVVPVGRAYATIGDLRHIIGRSARWHARTAISGFISKEPDEQLQAAISAGTSAELLCKAYLLTISPALIAEKGERDSLLHLSGNGHLARNDILGIKSIQLVDALKLVKHLHPAFPFKENGALPVSFARNAAIHMALFEAEHLRSAVIQLAQMTESLLGLLDLDRKAYWGERATVVVDSLLDEAAKRLEQIISAKVAVARSRLDTLKAGLPEGMAASILTSLAAGVNSYGRVSVVGDLTLVGDDGVLQRCPVCNQDGLLQLVFNEPDEVDTPYGSYIKRDMTGYPRSFECWVCCLALEDDELGGFDFPRSVDLPDQDEERWRDWTPDPQDHDEQRYAYEGYDDDDEQPSVTGDNADRPG